MVEEEKAKQSPESVTKAAWNAFILKTATLKSGSPAVKDARNDLTFSIRNRVSEAGLVEKFKVFAGDTIPDDPFERSQYDIVVDDLLVQLQQTNPNHPVLQEEIAKRPYWGALMRGLKEKTR